MYTRCKEYYTLIETTTGLAASRFVSGIGFNPFGTVLSLAAWAVKTGALTNDLLTDRRATLETITAGAIVNQ